MAGSLRRLCYFSRSLIRGSRVTINDEIERLMVQCRTRNRSRGITGMLLFSDGCFAQILEGDPDAVDMMFRRIEADPRHEGLVVLNDDSATERAFADWALMPFIRPDGAASEARPLLYQRLIAIAAP